VPRAGGEIPFPSATKWPLPSVSAIGKAGALRVTLKELRLDLMELRRELVRSKLARREGPPPRSRVVWRSPRYRAITSPRVSVITALYNHATWVSDALSSVERGVYQDYELIVVDDGSTDASLEAVRNWSSAHPRTALLLLQHPVNRGLPEARNCGLEFARGEYALILDADNDLLVNCLDRLVPALDEAPDAAFAYGMLACFDECAYLRLVSRFPWEPARLRLANYIDALALLRISTIRQMGGYTTDRRLYGWEDYDLYCRIAERGLAAAFVPEIVARYRVGQASMISLTNLSHITAFTALREHCPNLMAAQEMWFPVPPQIPTEPAPFDPQALPEPML
jgi:GT2 family glycosyltransferase